MGWTRLRVQAKDSNVICGPITKVLNYVYPTHIHYTVMCLIYQSLCMHYISDQKELSVFILYSPFVLLSGYVLYVLYTVKFTYSKYLEG